MGFLTPTTLSGFYLLGKIEGFWSTWKINLLLPRVFIIMPLNFWFWNFDAVFGCLVYSVFTIGPLNQNEISFYFA